MSGDELVRIIQGFPARVRQGAFHVVVMKGNETTTFDVEPEEIQATNDDRLTICLKDEDLIWLSITPKRGEK